MRTRSKVLLAALAAAVVLGALASDAGARRFEVSEQHFRAVFENLKFIGSIGTSFEIVCRTTLEGSFHSRTISKVCGQLIGFITRAFVQRPCTGGGEVWFLNGSEVQEGVTLGQTLPWHIRYDGFAGVLPRITRINIQVISYSLLVFFSLSRCLYLSNAERPAYMEFEVIEGQLARLRHDETRSIPLHSTISGICESTIRLAHDAPVTVQGRTTAINVRLVQ
jgi:hypothetical protein